MTQYPMQGGAGYDPLSYNSGVYQPSPRPTSVTVISVFAIVLGSLGLFCGGIALVLQILMLASGGRNPFMPTLPPMNDPAVATYGVVSGLISFVIAGSFLAAGIGGLKLRPLARRGMIGLSIFVMFFATITLVAQLVWVGPRTIEYSNRVQKHLKGPTPPAVVGEFQKAGQVVGAFIGWVVWCALPVCVLIFWRSPRVVSAFEGELPPQMGVAGGATWPPPMPPAGFT
jgi:hypothetical protein